MKLPPHLLSVAFALVLAGFIFSAIVTHKASPSSLPDLNRKKQTAKASSEEPRELADLVGRGFSALQVADDVYTADAEGRDFFGTYLEEHFPVTVSEADVAFLAETIEKLDPQVHTPSAHYKRGMVTFFLALSETFLLSTGNEGNPTTIAEHWNRANAEFQKAGDLGASIHAHLNRILYNADQNQDQHLDAQELSSIISSHLRNWRR
jgi:hypothetical protein